jgi:hypothetical protein
MEIKDDRVATPEGQLEPPVPGPTQEANSPPSTPKGSIRSGENGSVRGSKVEFNLPKTPSRSPAKKEPATTPRLKKKVPWKGKNIMILLPRDDERGQPGGSPMPLNQRETERMWRSWAELGYDTAGFDLNGSGYAELESYSMSRGLWPDDNDIVRERAERRFVVMLPDLNSKWPIGLKGY